MCMVTTMHAICKGLVAKLKYDFVKSKSIITFPDCSELPLKTEINQLKIKTEPVMHVENNWNNLYSIKSPKRIYYNDQFDNPHYIEEEYPEENNNHIHKKPVGRTRLMFNSNTHYIKLQTQFTVQNGLFNIVKILTKTFNKISYSTKAVMLINLVTKEK